MTSLWGLMDQRVLKAEFGSLGMAAAVADRELIIKALQDGIIIDGEHGLVFTERPSKELADALHRTLDTKAEYAVLNALMLACRELEIALEAVDDDFAKDHKGIVSIISSAEDTISATMHDIKYDMAKRCGL